MVNGVWLSIVMPVFQVEKFVEETLESIVNSLSDSKSVQVICIDDGSTDSSGAICKDFSSRYDCIEYIKQENKGVSQTRNAGIELAKGKYVTFIDSDDLVHDRYLPTALNIMKENDFDLCVFEYEDLPQAQNQLRFIRSNRKALFSTGNTGYDVYNRILNTNIHLSNVWSVIYKKDFLLDYNIRFNTEWTSSEDVDFVNMCLTKANKVLYSDQTSVIYRRYRDGSATNSMNNGKILCDLKVRVKWHEYINDKNFENSHYYADEFVSLMLVGDILRIGGDVLLDYIKKNKTVYRNAVTKKALVFKNLSKIFGEKRAFVLTKTITSWFEDK